MRKRTVLIVWFSCFLGVEFSTPGLRADSPKIELSVIQSAVSRSLPLLEKNAAGTAKARKCFTCHGQALPVMVMVEARKRGLAIDEDILKQQLQHTVKHLKRGKNNYLQGKGQGGSADTAGYALWTLETGDWEPDETTAAVTNFLLKYRQKSDHWSRSSNRPPSEASEFTTTYIALRGMTVFGTEAQQQAVAEKTARVKQWLLKAQPKDTEDRVFHLRALSYVNADQEVIQAAVKQLTAEQRSDGGWAQLPKMTSDAYATGTALVALKQAGDLNTGDPVYQRGLKFLIETQQDDGSWHVVTRSKPIQSYFETSFPHGKDQFISSSACGWATLALLLAMKTN